AHDALDAKHRAGLIYDSTWYAEQADTAFLCGTVFPFRPVSTCTGRILELVELPNVIEDGIVFGVYGEGTQRDTDGAVADGRRAIDAAVRRNGAVVFNWHQRVFALMDRYGNTPADWTVAYRRLAEYALEQPVDWWVALPSEIARWWLLRRQVRVSLLSDEVEVSNHACQEFQGALRLIWPNAEDVRPVTIQPNRSIRVRLRTR
ncbi:MAG: hypothetical protein H5T86_16505, partial [Armatimonadetes bacterium]|nr:hypothetical protein [Armatimonadota bacterium]